MPTSPRTLLYVSIALAVGLCSQTRAENLLLVTVDTLRADRLGCYGYRANPTPAIDRWAGEGVLFERVYAEVPLTLPSHASILTGTSPLFHGVRDNTGFVLAGDRTTLAEVLQQKGYRTAAFISAYVLSSRFGVGQGFEVYEESFSASPGEAVSTHTLVRDASETTGLLIEWLRSRPDGPFFAWLHLYDPHSPHRGGYDREVSRVDAAVAALDAELRRLQLIEETHLFLVSDHGEGLGEHGEATHGFFVYDSTLRVPWIVRPAAGFEPAVSRTGEPRSLMDVMPTALQLLGLPVPAEVQGRSALRALSGRPERPRPLYAESLVPELQFGWSPLKSVRGERYKLIEAPRPELYDLQRDPEETRNLYSENQALASRLRRQLAEFQQRYAGAGGTAEATVTAEDAERLAALGYVALGGRRSRGAGSGADPKDRIQVFERFQAVLNDLQGPPSAAVFDAIEAIRAIDPETRGLAYLEGLARERAGQAERALQQYRKALEEDPDNNLARGNLARLYLRLERLEEAERTFRQLLRRDAGDYRSRNNLALLLRLSGREEEAMRQLQEVVETAPSYASGWVNLGVGHARAGRLGEAEEALRKAVTLDPENAAAYFSLGRVLQGLGRGAEAREALETAARLDPRYGAGSR